MSHIEPNYYAVITAEVRYNDNISSSEKLFFAELTALANKTGKCWATNTYFAQLYGVDPSTVSKWVASLEQNGLIRVNYIKEGKQIKKRYISVTAGIENNQHPIEHIQEGVEKTERPLLKKSQGGIEKTAKSNTTSSNNTSRNITSKNTTTNGRDQNTSSKMRRVIQAWNETFEVEVDQSNKKLMKAVASATQKFDLPDLLRAMKYRSQAPFYKNDYPHLRDNPSSFFAYPQTIKNDMNRRPYKLISYEKKCELEMDGTDRKFEIDPEIKDKHGRPKWRMHE